MKNKNIFIILVMLIISVIGLLYSASPVAEKDIYYIEMNKTLNVSAPGVLENDHDMDYDVLEAVPVTGALNGNLILNSNGSFTYTPNTNFNGKDEFVYKVSDGVNSSLSVTSEIIVGKWYAVSSDDFENGWGNYKPGGPFANIYTGTDSYQGTNSVNIEEGKQRYSSFSFSSNKDINNNFRMSVGFWVMPKSLEFVNTPPIAVADNYVIDQDTTLNVSIPGVMENDIDVDKQVLKATRLTNVSNGSITLYSNGSFSYTPNPLFNGSDYFTYSINDGIANSSIVTAYITVNFVNTPPVANADSYTFGHNRSNSVAAPGVLTNDTDVDGQPLTASFISDPTQGRLKLNSDGSFYYIPNLGYIGADSFSYVAFDSLTNGNVATVNIDVIYMNTPPVAVDDFYLVETNTTLNVSAPGILTNDTDIDSDPLSAVLVSNVTCGTLTFNTNGSFDYTPDAGYDGMDSFTYRVNDGVDDGSIATVKLIVGRWIVFSDEDFEAGMDDFLISGGVNAGLYTASGGTNYAHSGTNCMYIRDDGVNNSFYFKDPINMMPAFEIQVEYWYQTITHNANNDDFFVEYFDGSVWEGLGRYIYSIDYTNNAYYSNKIVMDQNSFSFPENWNIRFRSHSTANTEDIYIDDIYLKVFTTNTTPVAVRDAYYVERASNFIVAQPGVMENDYDIQNDVMKVRLMSDVTYGTLALSTNGSFEYTSYTNFSGADSFSYQIEDEMNIGNSVTVDLTVGDWYLITYDDFEDGWGNYTNLGNINAQLVTNTRNHQGTNAVNIKDDTNSYFEYIDPVNIEVYEKLKIAFWYYPYSMENWEDFWVQYYNGTNWQTIATYVAGINQDFTNDAFYYEEVVIDKAEYNFPDNMKIRFLCDASGGGDHVTIDEIRVSAFGANSAPVANGTNYSIAMNTSLTGYAPAVDYNFDPLKTILMSGVTHGTLSLNTNDGTFIYTPVSFYTGGDTFSYKVNDGDKESNIADVVFNIYWVNTPATAVATNYSLDQDTTLVISAPGFIANDSDYDGDPFYADLVDDVDRGILTFVSNGAFTYDPVDGFSGSDSFSYRLFDGFNYGSPATVDLTINWINSPPVTVSDSYSVMQDTPLNIIAPGVLGNDTDVDGQALEAVPVSGVTQGFNFTLYSNGSFDYTPNPGYIGQDSFTYRANDGIINGNIVTVNIAVNGWIELSCDDFESGWGSYSGGVNASLLNDGTYAHSPTYSARLIGNSSSPGSFQYTSNMDVSTYSEIKIDYWCYPRSLDNSGEGYTVEYYNGSEWNKIASNYSGIDGFTNNSLYSNQIIISRQDYTFPTNMNLRFSIDALSGNDYVYFDDVCIYGLTGENNIPPTGIEDNYIASKDIVLNVPSPGILNNDIDPDVDPLSAIIHTEPTNGTVTLNSNGSFSYKPDPHVFGTDRFKYMPNDGLDNGNITTVNITIDEWTIITYDDFESGWSNYVSAGADAIRYTGGTYAHQGSACAQIRDNSDTSSFEYVVGKDIQDYNRLKIDFWFRAEGMDNTESFLIEYYDGSTWDTIATYTMPGDFNNGSFESEQVMISRTPEFAFPSDMKIRFRCDASTDDDNIYIDEILVTATYSNTPPIARVDEYNIFQDEILVVQAVAPFTPYYYKEFNGVLFNDSDYENDSLSAILVSNVTCGTLTLNSDGSFIYIPDGDYAGVDYFLYKANDGIDDGNIVKANISVYPDTDGWIELTYDNFESGWGNFTDGGADCTIYTGNNSHQGSNSINIQDDSGSASSFEHLNSIDISGYSKLKVELWFKSANFSGSEDFFIRYYDGSTWRQIGRFIVGTDFFNGEFTYKSVVIPNNSQNNFPSNMKVRIESSANSDSDDLYVDEVRVSVLPANSGTGLVTLSSWINQHLLYQLEASPLFPEIPNATGYITSTEAASNRYKLRNGNVIRGYVHPPVSGNYRFRVISEDGECNFWLSTDETRANIIERINNTFAPYPGIQSALIYLTAGNKYYFEFRQACQSGNEEYMKLMWECSGEGIPLTVLSGDWISPVWITNHPPVAYNDNYSTDMNTALNVPLTNGVLEDDYDNNILNPNNRLFEKDHLEAVLVRDVYNGTLILNGNGSFIYTPNNGYTGNDSFTYKVYDGQNYSGYATVTINVSDINIAPVAVKDRYNMYMDTVLNISAPGVLTNDSDSDGDSLTTVWIQDTANGTLVLNADGSFTYTPNTGFFGMDGFPYRANDGTTSGNTVWVDIWVYDTSADVCEVLREVWTGLTTATIDYLTNMADYPDNPDITNYINGFAPPRNWGNNYGQRLRGYFMPPESGMYSFTVNDHSSDDSYLRIFRSDESRLWMVTRWNGRVALEKGQKYLIDVIHVDAGNNDHCDVLWKRQGIGDSSIVISCPYVAPPFCNTPPIIEDENYIVFKNETLKMDSPGVLINATDGEDDTLTAILETDVSDGNLVLESDGSFTYAPDNDYTGTDSFTYKANDGFSDSATKTVTLNVVDGNNPNVKKSNWTYTAGTPASTLVSSARQTGIYAVADRSQDVIEMRGIRDELYGLVTASNIQEMMPWADISGPNYGICSISLTPSGRLLYIGVCASPDSPGTAPDGKEKDAILRYNINLNKYHLFANLVIASEMTEQKNFGLSYYRGELYVGTENGMYVYDAKRNMKRGVLLEKHVPSGNPIITGIDYNMLNEKVYITTPVSLFRLEGFVPFDINYNNGKITYKTRPIRNLELITTGSNFADVSFGRNYGGDNTRGLFILQNNSGESKIYRVPVDDVNNSLVPGLVPYTSTSEDLNGISCTPCGRMLLASPTPQIMSDNTDTRMNFDDFALYYFSNEIDQTKGRIKNNETEYIQAMSLEGYYSSTKSFPSISAAYKFALADNVLNDPDAENIVRESVRSLIGSGDVDFETSIDGNKDLMTWKWGHTGAMAARDQFGPKNTAIQNACDEYLNTYVNRLKDYNAMPGKSLEHSVPWGPMLDREYSELEGEGGFVSWLAAGQDPLQKRDWLDSLRHPWQVRARSWIQFQGYADQFERAEDENDPFDVIPAGGRWEQVLDDGEEYINRVDGNMYNWFYYFFGNEHYVTDPEWVQIFRNIIAAHQGLADERTVPYLGVFSWGWQPDYKDFMGQEDQMFASGDIFEPCLEVIDLEALQDLCVTGETFPAVACYQAYRDGKMVKASTKSGYNYVTYSDVWLFGRYCRFVPGWYAPAVDNISIGMAEIVKPGSLVEAGVMHDIFKIDLEVSTNTNGVVLEFSEVTPRRVLGSDDGVNWISYGFQYSPFILDNGIIHNHYRVEDPEGQDLMMVMNNTGFDDNLNGWSQSGDCTFAIVNSASGINIAGKSAEIRVTSSVVQSESSLRQTVELTNDFDNTEYIIRGDGFVVSADSPGRGFIRIRWDSDSNAGNGVISTLNSSYMSTNNRRVEFRIDTVKPAGARYMHVYFVVEPITALADAKRYIFDNMSIIRLGAPVSLNNNSFEDDLSNWVVNDNNQIFSITSEPKDTMEGNYALKIKSSHEDTFSKSLMTNQFNISGDPTGTRYIIRAGVRAKKQSATVVNIKGVCHYISPEPAATSEQEGIKVEPYFDGDYLFTLRKSGRSDTYVGLISDISIVIEVERAKPGINDIDEIIIDNIRIYKEPAWPEAKLFNPNP